MNGELTSFLSFVFLKSSKVLQVGGMRYRKIKGAYWELHIVISHFLHYKTSQIRVTFETHAFPS